jgi:hypothetical protein
MIPCRHILQARGSRSCGNPRLSLAETQIPDAPVTRTRRRSSGGAFTLSPPWPKVAGAPPATILHSSGWSGALGAQLAEEASVIGADVFFDHPAAVVECEHVHEVPDDAGPVRFKAASR